MEVICILTIFEEQENQEQLTTKPMILSITLAPFLSNLLPKSFNSLSTWYTLEKYFRIPELEHLENL